MPQAPETFAPPLLVRLRGRAEGPRTLVCGGPHFEVTPLVAGSMRAVKLLDVITPDPSLTFDKHVTNVVRPGSYHTRAPLLTTDAEDGHLPLSIVGARLDYCNQWRR